MALFIKDVSSPMGMARFLEKNKVTAAMCVYMKT